MNIEDVKNMVRAYGHACANCDNMPKVSPSIFELDAQNRLREIDSTLSLLFAKIKEQ